MVRTQIQLTDEQMRRLQQLAAKRKVSMAELVRQGVDLILKEELLPDLETRRARALAALGRFRSDVSDLSENHDKYFAEAIMSGSED